MIRDSVQRRVGISRKTSKRLHPSENAHTEQPTSAPGPEQALQGTQLSENVHTEPSTCDSEPVQALQGSQPPSSSQTEVFHSTAIGTPRKRIALINPFQSDDEGDDIISSTPTPPQSQGGSQVLSLSLITNERPQLSNSSRPLQELVPQQQIPQLSQARVIRQNAPILITAPSGCPDFSLVLQQCGFILSTPPARNYIHVDQLLFRKQLGDWVEDKLKEEPQGNANPGKKFITSMRNYLSNQRCVLHSMTPTQHPGSILQSSLLHNLLCVSVLQKEILEVLFPLLAEATFAEGNQQSVDTLASILNQFKWLPVLVEPDAFMSNILQVLQTATPGAQKEMILCLPEILPEDKHSKIADALKKLLDKAGAGVIPAIMDCFSSLDIPTKEWIKIREAAVSQMFNSSLADFPAFFAFLFRTEDVGMLAETISSMRESLELTPLGQDAKSNVHMIEIVEKIRFCSSVNQQLVPVWVKQVKDDLDCREDITPVDLIMLLIFCENHKLPFIPLRMLFSDEKQAIKLLDNLLKNNLPILNQVFKTLVKLCESFLRGKEIKAHSVMEHILVNLFIHLSVLESQEIALTLSNILMDGTPTAREASLRVLTTIAKENPAKLLLFAPYLMSVLECIMRFGSNQIRHLMNVLAILAHVEGNRDSERFASEFSILLRKQLTHSVNSTRCFGVIGALATVRQLSQQTTNVETNTETIERLLKLVWSLVEREEDACLVFFDELSAVAHLVPSSICRNFRDMIASKFQEFWTTTDSCSKRVHGEIKLSESFDANKELVDQLQLLITFEEKPLGMSALVVPSHLRLAGQLIFALEDGDLSLIDAVLGCPVILPDIDMYYKDVKSLENCTYDQKIRIGRYLVLAINFFRESVSVFVDNPDPELRIKIWLRLSNLVLLQQLLVKNFTRFPSLPLAYVAENIGTNTTVSGPIPGPSGGQKALESFTKKKAAGAGKGKGNKSTNSEKEKTKKPVKISKKNDADEETAPKPNPELENLIQPKSILPYLRRLDKKVLSVLLRAPLNDGSALDVSKVAQHISSSPAKQLEEVGKFTPETLVMLLIEMIQQSNDPRNSFDVLDIKNMVSSLCMHLDSIVQLYQNENLSAVDEGRFESCFRLILKIFSLVLESIQKYPEEVHTDLLSRVVSRLVKRLKPPANQTDGTFSDKLKKATEYFSSLSNSIRNPSTAVEHLLLLKRLDDLAKEPQHVVPFIEKVSKAYLKKGWKLSSAQVDIILKTWLSKSTNPLQVMKGITKKIIPNDGKTCERIPNKDYFQSCNAVNFHIWYSTIISTLAHHVHKAGKRLKSSQEVLEFWNTAVLVMRDLVLATQQIRKNVFLLPLLKYSRPFFEAISNHGVKKLPSLIDGNTNDAKVYIKHLQAVTRKVQIVCEHSKVQKDTQLLKFVPLLRKVLEVLIFRVREVLASSGLAAAFVMGSLKRKNLDGNLINSQPYNMREDENNEESESDDDVRSNVTSEGASDGEDEEMLEVGVDNDDIEMDDPGSPSREYQFPQESDDDDD